MSTSTEITRLETARNTIRSKMVALGLGQSTDKLDDLATEINGITNRGTISEEVMEGESYSLSAGYYQGGTVKGVAGGGHYELQSKTVTPTTQVQVVDNDSGYYGLDNVTVDAIPSNYKDISGVTAAAGDVLATKVYVNSAGVTTTGTMANNGTVTRTLDTTTTSTTIPIGYHSGSGTVSISLETKTATPTTSQQSITPSTGKVLSGVTVNAIPAQYADTSDADAAAANILYGKVAYGYDSDETEAVKLTGSMPNNGAQSGTLDTTTTSKSIPAGYTSGGTVSISLEEKSATPTTSAQNITPTSGKVLSKVTVNAIPSNYKDTTGTDAVAANILSGKKAVNTTGTITGSMANNGTISGTITGLGSVSGDTSYTIPAGYTSGGTVSITSDIETSLAAI